jgi:uncharacterized membrane protein YbhN (UPF0104 family)
LWPSGDGLDAGSGKTGPGRETGIIGRLARSPLTRILLVGAAVAAAFPLAGEAQRAVERLGAADRRQVVAAGLLHLAVLFATSLCWRRSFGAFGSRIGGADACMRYGVGTFINAVAPARAGGVVRIGLFTRSLSGEHSVQRSGTALLAIASVRATAVTSMLAIASIFGAGPRWLLAAPAVVIVLTLFVRQRLRLLAANLSWRCTAELLSWATLAAACRCLSIVSALAAVGVPSPLAAGVVGWLGLELAALVPLAPGLAGVSAAGIVVAVTAHGVTSATAMAGGVAFYAAETVAGILFGAVATSVFLIRNTPLQHRTATASQPNPA